MKTLAFLLVILVLFTFSSCSYILGLKSPTKIDKQFAISYLLKHDIDTSNVIFLKNGYLDTLKYLPFKPNWEPGFRPLQFKIFSKTGNLVSQYSSCEGSLKHTLIKKVFPPINITPIDTAYFLTDEERFLEKTIDNTSDADYITLIYWATYTGIPGRHLLKKVEKELRKNKGNLIVYKVNTDDVE
jgi:hypothetical protein